MMRALRVSADKIEVGDTIRVHGPDGSRTIVNARVLSITDSGRHWATDTNGALFTRAMFWPRQLIVQAEDGRVIEAPIDRDRSVLLVIEAA